MKFILTGGHLTPAHAFALQAQSQSDSLAVIGSMGETDPEYRVFNRLQIPYHRILPVKFDRYHLFVSLFRLPLLLVSLLQCLLILNRYQPDAVIVFGGYTGIPVALAAKIFGIPIILHEQTRSVGLANRLISRIADLAAISYETSRPYLKTKPTVLTTNLLRPEIWSPPENLSVSLPTAKPILFITGGNQGSAVILDAVTPLLADLTRQYQLVVQSGRVKLESEYNHPEIISRSWFDAADLAWLMHHAHLIVCRAGANTVAELMVAALPAVLIPLPRSSHQEQAHNAQMIADAGAGILLPQANLNPTSLSAALQQLESDYSQFKSAATGLKSHQAPDAAQKFYQLIVDHLAI